MARIGVIALPQNSKEADAVVDNLNQLYGVDSAVKIDLMVQSKNLKRMTNLISNQTGIFIVDSVRYRQQLIKILRPFGSDSALLMAIKKVLIKGGMVAGTSNIMVTYYFHVSNYSTFWFITVLKREIPLLSWKEMRWALLHTVLDSVPRLVFLHLTVLRVVWDCLMATCLTVKRATRAVKCG